jgi:glycosyltransferase involved in cell wall biosynthesis
MNLKEMISVCIPVLNEADEDIARVVENVTYGYKPSDIEIIIYNDGSMHDDGSFRVLKPLEWGNCHIIDHPERHGVGYGLDTCVNYAIGDTIMILGSDVYPERGKWLQGVLNALKPQEIGCATSVGLFPGEFDINIPNKTHRYGAEMLYKITIDDLPPESDLRKDPDYRDILNGRWASKKSDEPYEISCLMGAMYWMPREFYLKMGGFDTKEGETFRGHIYWGHLEAHLSLKAKVYGGKCVVYPDIRAGHTFGRITEENSDKHRAMRDDYRHWNALWIAHTMIEESFRDELINFPRHSLNFSTAQAMIRRNWDVVEEVRNRNIREGKLISKDNENIKKL